MKLPRLFVIYIFALIASLFVAVEASLYLKDQRYIMGREEAINASYIMDEYIDFYNNTLQSLYAFYKADSIVSNDEMDLYFDMWKQRHVSKEHSLAYYGLIDQKNKKNSFYTHVGQKEIVAAGLSARKIVDLAKMDNSFVVLEKPIPEREATIFIALDLTMLKYSLTAKILEHNPKLRVTITKNEQYEYYHPQEVLYGHSFQLGEDKIHADFYAREPWNYFGKENGYSYIIFFIAFVLQIWLATVFMKASRKVENSEIAKDFAEKKYEEQNKFFTTMIENLPGILFVKDVQNDYKLFMVNKAAEQFFGYPREELIGSNDEDFFSEEESSFFRSVDEATMAGGKVVDIPCEIVTTPKGEMFVHTRKLPIYDADGKPQYLIGLSEDITKRKRNEMELSNYRENLENMVNERTEKLKIAINKAEEANRLKSEFLATMSHEIRSPMSGVLGMAELLLDTPLTSDQKGLTKTILNSGEILMNIIEDILDFSKIEANKLELDPIAINMLELVDDVCMLYSTKARDKALELAVRYVPGSEPFVYADPVRIRQVLGNLINNAIKFTQTGHVIVTVREDPDETLPLDKVKLVFTIEDSGIGIEEDDQKKIFEKFSQANSSTTRNYGGTGLGLSICKKLIEMMNGEITLSSVVGQGSKFEFFLPMTRNEEEYFVPPKPPVLKDLRVLIVDDLPVIRTILTEQLTNAGMICDCAVSGHQALEKLMEARDNGHIYDIAIVDYLMPGMNGEMLARAINDEEDFRDICLIMLTAAGNPIVADDYAEKGFSAYISKPVKALQLIDTLAIVWSKYKEGYTDTLIRVDTQSLGNAKVIEDNLHLDGSNILLVEDSRLNQAFAEEVLSQLSCDVITVSNGQEAVDVVQKNKFDLVLMDCQMPVMDGFEAARQITILKQKGLVDKNLPILALTANAMKGDRQRCIDAGMNDYITKPVRKKELKEKIFSWIKKGSQADSATKQSSEEGNTMTHTAAAILDRNILNEAKGILKDKFDFMMDCYIEDVENYIHEIQEAVIKHDLEALVRPAHTIKSTSRRMGALQLSDIAKDIELCAREAANTNTPEIWKNSTMIDKIQSISSVFEETKDHLLKTRMN